MTDIETPDEQNPDADLEAIDAQARVLELEAQLEETRTELDDAHRQISKLSQAAASTSMTVDITARLYSSIDDVYANVSEDTLREIASAELADLNRGRLRRGYHPIEWSADEWSEQLRVAAESLLADVTESTVPTEGRLSRVLKVVNPRSGNVVQIPMEDQVNNHRGSLADSTVRYQRKGFKIAVVVLDKGTPNERVARLCATLDCNRPSSVDASGVDLLDGYCTEDHRNRTEAGQGSRATAGV